MRKNILLGAIQFPLIVALSLTSCSNDDVTDDRDPVFCVDGKHPHQIDLGLPSGTVWSCCNVGANSPLEAGGHYALGEISVKSDYNWRNYAYYIDNGHTEYFKDLGDVSSTKYDAAFVVMGHEWRIPSLEQMQELIDQCTWTWTEIQGVGGMKVTGPNGKSLFLSASGFYYGDELKGENTHGYYWTSGTITDRECFHAYSLFFRSGQDSINYFYRSNGHSMRPIHQAIPKRDDSR